MSDLGLVFTSSNTKDFSCKRLSFAHTPLPCWDVLYHLSDVQHHLHLGSPAYILTLTAQELFIKSV